MSILTYIRKLMPSFKKNSILESIELTTHGIRETSLPAYQAAEQYFATNKISSKEAKDLVTVYEKRVGRPQGGSVVADIREALENATQILAFIGTESKHLYSDTEANVSLTYVKATYLRLIEATEFASAYSLKWLNQLYILETAEVDSHVKLRTSLSPAEVQWLQAHYFDFLTCIAVLKKSVKDIEKGVKEMPDAMITDLTESTFPTTVGTNKVDPFALRQLSAAVNPSYLIGLWLVERQAKAYKAKKAELELLQMRLLNLQRIAEKSPDARLQKEIDYMADRVSGMNYEILKTEKEYLND